MRASKLLAACRAWVEWHNIYGGHGPSNAEADALEAYRQALAAIAEAEGEESMLTEDPVARVSIKEASQPMGRLHLGDPCIYCDTPHDRVVPGSCPGRPGLDRGADLQMTIDALLQQTVDLRADVAATRDDLARSRDDFIAALKEVARVRRLLAFKDEVIREYAAEYPELKALAEQQRESQSNEGPITQDALDELGWNRFEWTKTKIVEWWKGSGGPGSELGRYIAVRFDGLDGHLFGVFIMVPFGCSQMMGVTSLGKLITLLQLVEGREEPVSKFASRTDHNQTAIAARFTQLGCKVKLMHRVGGGHPDLTCSISGLTFYVEVKTEGGSLNERQKEWNASCSALSFVARTERDADTIVNAILAARLCLWQELVGIEVRAVEAGIEVL